MKLFRAKISSYYQKNKRSMPWRETQDPYRIFVSEVMLQQTQVDRVRVKYSEFLSIFPTPKVLARASVAEVITVWKGLGYNRRALNLKRAMEIVVQKYAGIVPKTVEELDALPGIGPATAAAICAYAFNQPTVFIETNIRSVFIDHFFRDSATDTTLGDASTNSEKISDAQLMPLIEESLDHTNPREWYYALMDYGTMLKRTRVNPSRRSRHHTKQSKFEGSHRQMRGRLLEYFIKERSVTWRTLEKVYPQYSAEKIKKALSELVAEGFVSKQGGTYSFR